MEWPAEGHVTDPTAWWVEGGDCDANKHSQCTLMSALPGKHRRHIGGAT